MSPEREIVKAYNMKPITGIEARVLLGDEDGVMYSGKITADNTSVTAKVFLNGTVSVSTERNPGMYGGEALHFLYENMPELYEVVSKTSTDFKILEARQTGKGSFLFPEMFACDEGVVDSLISEWQKDTGRNVYLTKQQKTAFYQEFFMPMRGNVKVEDAEEIRIDEITAWLKEQGIPAIGRGDALIKVEEDRILVKVSMVGSIDKKQKPIELTFKLNSSTCLDAQLKTILNDVVYTKFDIG